LSKPEDAFRAFEFGQARVGAGGEGVFGFHGGSPVGLAGDGM